MERANRAGEHEEADLGRGVEAKAEQEPNWIHLPAPVDGPEQPTEDASEEAALVEHGVDIVLAVDTAVGQLAEGLHDLDEDDDVDDRHGEAEERGHAGANQAGGRLER